MSQTWQLALRKLTMLQHQEKGSWLVRSGDEPYFIMIGFRATFGVAGSAQVFTNSYRDDTWGENITRPQERMIPDGMGVLSFPGITPVPARHLPDAEVFGAVVIAMESDNTPWGTIDALVGRAKNALLTELRTLIERRALRITHARPDLQDAVRRVQAATRQSIWGMVKTFVFSGFDPDDRIGFGSAVIVACDSSVVVGPSTHPNATVSNLQPRPVSFRFVGDAADYEVAGAVSRTA
jgi:hypothetical protein